MKEKRKKASLRYFGAVLFYVAAILRFAASDDTEMGIAYLCLGTLCLCLGILSTKMAKKGEKEQNGEEDKKSKKNKKKKNGKDDKNSESSKKDESSENEGNKT